MTGIPKKRTEGDAGTTPYLTLLSHEDMGMSSDNVDDWYTRRGLLCQDASRVSYPTILEQYECFRFISKRIELSVPCAKLTAA